MAVHQKTIVALASGRGRSGIGVVRLSGPKVRFITETIAGKLPPPRTSHLCDLADPASGLKLDRALVLFFPAPHSFTGDDVAEFHLHGSPAVVSVVIQTIVSLDHDIMIADPGAFTRRAFENGKMDLAAVEGLGDLIDSETEWQRRQALRQMEGVLGRVVARWRVDLIACMALVESDLDFSDEADVGGNTLADVLPTIGRLEQEMLEILGSATRGERLREGYRVVIIGAPNAGKSSLLNAIARRDVAIVSPVAGTTRDVIEIRCDFQGYPVLLSDTAGLRDSVDEIERMGMSRALKEVNNADIVLLLREAGGGVPAPVIAEGPARTIRVATKCDLADPWFTHDVAVSALTGAGMDRLFVVLGEMIEQMAGGETALISNLRQRQALDDACQALGRLRLAGALEPELVAEELRHAVNRLDLLIGKVDVEQVLDQVFSRFCIGK